MIMERGKEGKNEEVRLEICEVEMEGKQGIHGGNQKEEGMGLLEEIETKQESSEVFTTVYINTLKSILILQCKQSFLFN